MSSRPRPDDDEAFREALRQAILRDPALLLDDSELMRALVAANDRAMGPNVVDLRGLAMSRLEARLDRLEDTHRSVIAAAYENLAGTNQIHRAVLRLLEPATFGEFLQDLGGDVAAILRVESLRLVLESAQAAEAPPPERTGGVLAVEEPGFVEAYLRMGRTGPIRSVTLRQIRPEDGRVHGERAADIRSEACLRLDLGEGVRPAMLVLGSEDPHHFSPQQGTDLLGFFAGVFERTLRRWLG
ncbi:DUF484 family protein [Rubellimicrobium sp. CFH 75288]|uniref:DUF484 family protein n=1 Tax=Rubellimicrobium sp. CFH 75288 TaxID=2697034 RepID=UPI001412B4BE|nr:DUF484 family protein [Rubellimicrobium sp. CFH 75288]NAZ36753.1 DUF484 family protein [Rubellimicrobium sp. CFH 75288]